MSEITLREYNELIADRIEEGRYSEAAAHAKHILTIYPKYVTAYRLLGEALLEAGQDEAAMEMFRRALSADPENLLAWVGLSEIHNRRGNLESAVWHMERAFELESNNTLIEEQLRQLQGRRDGVEPRRVQLTRGALARLYLKGDLLSRAVSEFRKLLTQQPERIDLRVALAEALWRNEQRLEASELCEQILDELPYCLKANLLLGDIWSGSGREEARLYLRRATALDPEHRAAEALFGSDSLLPVRDVTVPLLDYQPSTPSEQPSWMEEMELDFEGETAPLALQATEDQATHVGTQIEIPEWLAEIAQEQGPTEPGVEEGLALTAGELAEELPEWATEAALSAGVADEETAQQELAELISAEDQPGWLPTVEELGSREPAEQAEWMPVGEEASEAPVAVEFEETPVETLAEETLAEEIGVREAAVEGTLAEAIITEETLFELTEEIAIEEAAAAETAVAEAALPEEILAEETFAGEALAEAVLAEETTAEVTPAEEIAVEETPVQTPEWLAAGGLPSGEDALAWLEQLSAGKEDELRAAASAEAERRMAEIMGRQPAPQPEPEAPEAIEEAQAAPEAPHAAEPAFGWTSLTAPEPASIEAALPTAAPIEAAIEEMPHAAPEVQPEKVQPEAEVLPEATIEAAPPVAPDEVVVEEPVKEAVEETLEQAPEATPETEPATPVAGQTAARIAAEETAVPEAAPEPEPPLTGAAAKRARLRTAPRDYDTWLSLARDLQDAGEHAEALEAYGKALRSKRLVEQVVSDLEKRVEQQPDAATQRLLGDAYMKAGRVDDALRLYQQALKAF